MLPQVKGERIAGFNPKAHVSRAQLSYDQDREGQQVTVLCLPHTKVSPQGEDVCWAKQDRPMDPDTALAHHLEVNNLPQDGHLFAYCHKNGYRPLTRTKFLAELARAACTAGLEPLQGHGIRIGSILEYLLRGVPFDVMKVKGRWSIQSLHSELPNTSSCEKACGKACEDRGSQRGAQIRVVLDS